MIDEETFRNGVYINYIFNRMFVLEHDIHDGVYVAYSVKKCVEWFRTHS